MSGYQRPRNTTSRGRLVLPRVASTSAAAVPVNGGFASIEMADAENLKRGQEAAVPSLVLTDSTGVSWRVTVTPAGVLHTVKVAP